jgi:hypothetical protein
LDKHTTLNAAECSWLQSRQNKKGGNLTEKRNNKREEEEEDRQTEYTNPFWILRNES